MDILKALGLKRAQPEPKPQAVGQHTGGNVYPSNLVVPWTRMTGRKKLEEDLVRMDENNIVVGVSLDKTADYFSIFDDNEGLSFGFKIVTAEADGDEPTALQKKAVGILNDLVDRVKLSGQMVWDIGRDMVRKGNVFTETVLSADLDEIAAVRQFPWSWQIEKNIDNSGNLKTGDPKIAVQDPKQSDSAAYTQINDMGKVIAAFWPYQIVHWAFGPMGGKTYAEPIGGKAVKSYKRLDAGLDSLGVARVIRAWDTNIHLIPMPFGLTGDEVAQKVSEYQYIMERDEITTYDSSAANFQSTPKYSPTDVARDYYMPVFYTSDGKVIPGDIKKLQPSTAALQHLEDIEMGIELLRCTFGVPQEIIGLDIGQKPMVDKTAPLGMEAFSKYIRRLQFAHNTGLKQIFDIELLLHGINPSQPLYKVIYPGISPQTAEINAKILLSKGQTATYYDQMMVPEELTGKKLLDFDANDVKKWQANIQANAAKGIVKGKGATPVAQPAADPGEPKKPNTKGK